MVELTDSQLPAAPASSSMREEEVIACSFDNWYAKFKDISLRSSVIPLSEDFVQYLLADGISMPGSVGFNAGNDENDDNSEWGDGGSDSEDSNENCHESTQVASFPELQLRVDEAIMHLGGSVLPKLNWSAPKDARWILGSLKCDTALEVFTLLKASDFVAHDLCHSFDDCDGSRQRPDEFVLVLRRWYDLAEAGEFRCFVHERRLVAVSQRNTNAHFPHLSEAAFMDEVVAQVSAFFEAHLQNVFPLERYAFDVFVGKPPRRKVSLIDFSPWGATTDPLLFAWEELCDIAAVASEHSPVIRTVKNEADVRTKLENYHQMPMEVAQMGGYSTSDIEGLCSRAQVGISAQQM